MTPEFRPFPKMARLSRECLITEKIDGTNSSIYIAPLEDSQPVPKESLGVFDIDGKLHFMLAGSRNRWLHPQADNFGFAHWVTTKFDELKLLGPGHHFGEWWGQGIQRGYGIKEKRFSLFNVSRWALHGTEPQVIPSADPRVVKTQDVLPLCCGLVPLLYRGMFDTERIETELDALHDFGSAAAPGFMDPEGIVVFHIAGNVGFKKTLKNDHQPKNA